MLAVQVLSPVLPEQQSPQLVDARHRFAKKRCDHKYRWTPSPELETAIVSAVFGKKRI